MPELPEVEVVRHGLAPAVTGSTVTAVHVFDERSLKRHTAGPQDFRDFLIGTTIQAAVRRGKFLWFPLSNSGISTDRALIAHLGMSGQLLLRRHGSETDRFTRVGIDLVHPELGDFRINFADQRIFGSLAVDELVPMDGVAGFSGGVDIGLGMATFNPLDVADSGLIPAQVAHISRDALDPYLDVAAFQRKIADKNVAIKRILLDQNLISGIGNIYADEALWAAKIHYEMPAKDLSAEQVLLLLQEVQAVLKKALGEGGTSFDAQYVNVNGEAGYFAHSLNAYGKQGEPCKRCDTQIVREKFMNRGSHFCPRCQRRA